MNDDTEWIYDRLGQILRCMNGMHWRFDINGFHEHLQYTVYHDDKSFYRWHVDNMLLGDMPPRKLSMSVQLTDPNDYDGGELQTNDGVIHTVSNDRGLVTVFPSYVLHRVTPVTPWDSPLSSGMGKWSWVQMKNWHTHHPRSQ